MKGITIVLPSLNPDERLNMVVDGLLEQGFTDIVIVNDGSDEEHSVPFEKAAEKEGVTVLVHEVNKGKGRALKTAFEYVVQNRADIVGVVTADGDNQHASKDILACAEKMKEADKVVLGCRNFSLPDIPPKSRFGNVLTSAVFRIFCGIRLSDTQTGLRAIPARYLPLLCQVEGERFEYETQMLFAFKKHRIEFLEQTIETVYTDNNASTHFDPFWDSLKIYKIILKFTASSLMSFCVDYVLFTILVFALDGAVNRGMRLFVATFAARVVSSGVNYCLNKKAVFHSNASAKRSLVRYYILCLVQTGLSYGLLYLLSRMLGARPVLETALKLAVDLTLFLLSFQVQRKWVFQEEKGEQGAE